MSRWIQVAALALLLVVISGCGWLRPRGSGPGDIYYQRNNAVLHDPYPDNDAGPEMVGVRPREYQKPRAEPVRSRLMRDAWWWRQGQ